MKDPELKKGSFLSITLLILSGELIFLLPYVLARVFRPTFLEVFNLTNLQLGEFWLGLTCNFYSRLQNTLTEMEPLLAVLLLMPVLLIGVVGNFQNLQNLPQATMA